MRAPICEQSTGTPCSPPLERGCIYPEVEFDNEMEIFRGNWDVYSSGLGSRASSMGWGLWEWSGRAGWLHRGNPQPDPSLHWEKWELWWE